VPQNQQYNKLLFFLISCTSLSFSGALRCGLCAAGRYAAGDVVGDSGLGKTQFCKAFVKEKGLKTLIVNHKEDFRRLNSTYDAIIIDDANIHEFEETQLLSLIDNETDKTLRVLYNSVVKKAVHRTLWCASLANFVVD